ncbi:MAG: T9SS type A sorting domain-containing protein [Bacteroidetes bacterium]|nr:T9SS type A sorting domain-containing protein [Bacteroidota bacterium]
METHQTINRALGLLLYTLFSFTVMISKAQTNCNKVQQQISYAKTTVANLQEDDYDVQYVKLDLKVSNVSTAIAGSATTIAKVVAPFLMDYFFELSNQLTIDSALVNGQKLMAVSVAPYVWRVSLPTGLTQNSIFYVNIYYHGSPSGGTGFFTNGLLQQTDGIYGVSVTHTVSAAIHSRDWWPCKQSLTDKIDSADIWITVPNGLKVAGNGLLKNITAQPTGNRYEWASRYPADYYLLSFAVAPYTEYNYQMHFSGSTDSMLIQNYLYNVPSILQQHQGQLDSLAQLINYFSSLFGRYPFYKEKFGVCMTPLAGGMENQTMVSLGSLDIQLMAHELSHQWWGDNVTCQSLADMWLNEGWATYCEQLFLEHFRGAVAAKAQRTSVFNDILLTNIGSVYVDDTTQEGRIYSSRFTYNKGAAVAHMLRYVVNNDALYFLGLKNYHQQFKFSTATTNDLKNVMNQATGLSLDTFFQQWIFGEGFPKHNISWAQSGNNVVVKLDQFGSKPSSVSVFKMPIDIQLKSASGDTLIRVMNDRATQYYVFQWNPQMNGIVLDPNDQILNKVLSISNDNSILDIQAINELPIQIFPNPSLDYWTVQHIKPGTLLKLFDVTGKLLFQKTAQSDSYNIPSKSLLGGVYTLQVWVNNTLRSYQLIRQ